MSINEHTVGAIVLNWNSGADSIACARSLLSQTYKNLLVVLVDNNSSDDSPVLLQQFAERHSNVVYRHNSVNLGFTGGINTGIRYCLDKKINYIALLNPDATANKNWLSSLHNELVSHSDTGIITGLFINSQTGLCDSTGEFYTTWGLPGPRNRGDDVKKAPTKPGYVFGASGGNALYRASVFDVIGFFDEQFFMYYEDVDISWRTQLTGHKVYYEKSAQAYHKHSATSSKIPGFTTTQVFQNLPLVFWKNVPARLLWPIGWRFFLAYNMFFVWKISQGGFRASVKGIWRSCKLLPHAFRERRKIQKSKIVDTTYLKTIIWPNLPMKSFNRIRKLFGIQYQK